MSDTETASRLVALSLGDSEGIPRHGNSSCEALASLERQAQTYMARHQAEFAIPLIESLLAASPDNAAHGLLLAQCLIDTGDFDAARVVCADLINRLRGPASSSRLATEPAAASLSLCVGLSPSPMQCSPPSVAELQQISTNAADIRTAARLFARCSIALNDFKRAAAFAERLCEACATDVEALCVLARASEVAGNTAHAAELFKKAFAIDPLQTTAYDGLVERFLLPRREVLELINSVEFPPEAAALRDVYRFRVAPELRDPTSSLLVPKWILHHKKAEVHYQNNELTAALQHSSLAVDGVARPNRDAVCLHLVILHDLGAVSKLYHAAHALLARRSRHPLAYYAIGCYYYANTNYDKAGKFFCRAAELDPCFPHAAVAFGHCYAKLEEGEQALGSYRRGHNAFPGLHVLPTYLGMQYARAQSYGLALCCLEEARRLAPDDPLVINEIGVVYFKTGKLMLALSCFESAWKNVPNQQHPSQYLDAILFNWGTCLRKSRDYPQALEIYARYAKLRPNASHAHIALGFTSHLAGDIKGAIEHYHIALALKPDVFCRDMLERALMEQYSRDVGGGAWTASLLSGNAATSVSPQPIFTGSSIPRPRGGAASSESASFSVEPSHIDIRRTLTF